MNKVTFSQTMKAGVFAAITSLAINAVLFYVFKAAGTINDGIFIQPNQPLTILPIIISSIMPTIVASLVFFLFEKFTRNGYKIFAVLSIILGRISLTSPFMAIKDVTTGFAIVLDIMHVVVVVSLLIYL